MKKLLSILLVFFIAFSLESCAGYTWKYHTIITYHYQDDAVQRTITHDFDVNFNSNVDNIETMAFANTYDNGHRVKLVYVVKFGQKLVYEYDMMNIPDKVIVIDNVTTNMVSKIKN